MTGQIEPLFGWNLLPNGPGVKKNVGEATVGETPWKLPRRRSQCLRRPGVAVSEASQGQLGP